MNLSKKNNLVSSSNYKNFKIVSDFKSSGDQPGAIKSLVDNLLIILMYTLIQLMISLM